MRIGILGGEGTWHVEQLVRECHAFDVTVTQLDYKELPIKLGYHANDLCNNLDAILVRHVPAGTLEQTLHFLNVLHNLSSHCFVMNGPRCIELSTDKVLACIQFTNHSIPIPKTVATENLNVAMALFHELHRDVVIKPLTGSLGRGIARVDDPDIAWRIFHSIIQTSGIVILQEYIQNDGYDIRLFVIARQVVAAMQRSSGSDWRYNIARGGIGQDYTPTEQQVELAIAAAEAVGADHAGVDLMHSRDGRDVVIEVNAIPGWKTLSETTGVNIAHLIVTHMTKQL